MGWRLVALCALCPLLMRCADDFDSLRDRAEQARMSHDVETACDLYRQALAARPDWADGWWYLGNLLFVSNQYSAAESALHHFTDLRPDLGEAWGMRAIAAARLGLFSDALKFSENSLALPFNAVPTLQSVIETNHAFLLSKAGRFEDALSALQGYTRGRPNPDLLNALGIAALRRKSMPDEVSSEDRVLTEAAGQVEYDFLTSDPDVSQAAQDLVNRFPNAPGVHYLAGMVFFAGQQRRAEAEFARELTLDPANAAAGSMLAYSQFALGETSPQSLQLAKKAVDADPSNPGFQYVFGVISDAEGSTKDALAALQKAVQLKPRNAEYHVALSVEYSKDREFQQAYAERRRALDLKFGQGD